MVASSSSLPVTGYLLHNGRANLSLWPFSSGNSSKPAETASTSDLASDTLARSASDAAASSPSSNALSSAASTAQDTASSVAAQAQSTLHDAATAVSSATESVLEPNTASLPEPTFLSNITEVGQLKELGLEYGWGPTSIVEWVVEHIHVYAGTPWVGTIILSSIAMRLVMIYPFFKMSDQQAKMQQVQPQMKKHMAAYQAASAEGDRMAAQIATKQLQLMRHRAGIHMSWMFAPLVIQGILGFGAFKLTRAMAALPVPGFETGGFAWITNLAVADPLYITPLALWLTMHLLARVSPPHLDLCSIYHH
jgi:YidC/Oxa1 family membrane protein insertase